jgi:hypothetical protein
MPARKPPERYWRSYGTDPLPTGAEALDEPFRGVPVMAYTQSGATAAKKTRRTLTGGTCNCGRSSGADATTAAAVGQGGWSR